jgi:hypothetical protein
LERALAAGKEAWPAIGDDADTIDKLRAEGLGWKKTSREVGVGVSTVFRIAKEAGKSGSENPKPKTFRTLNEKSLSVQLPEEPRCVRFATAKTGIE